jgi:hypothetical protein
MTLDKYLLAIDQDFAMHTELTSSINGRAKVGSKDDKVQSSFQFSKSQDRDRGMGDGLRSSVDGGEFGIKEFGFELLFGDFVAMVGSCFSFG